MNRDITKLPDNLPVPHDDGACNHLLGMMVPKVRLNSTKARMLELSSIDSEFLILYFFPMMFTSENLLPINWNKIPGARGCTPQNITVNNNIDKILYYKATIIGISTQPIEELTKISRKRKFTQIILSDPELKLKANLNLPTFRIDEKIMYKRITLIIKKSKIIKVFYPIFPPDKHIFEIIKWLNNQNT